MAKAIGFGGAFIRARDPKALYSWYEQHLGLKSHGCFVFPSKEQPGDIAVSFFAQDDVYFPTQQPAMLNFQVDDLHALLDALTAAGVTVDANRQDTEYGLFGWITDPEGNRVELWQPKP